MIPWVREKIAEKRLRWLTARQSKRTDSKESVVSDTENSLGSGPSTEASPQIPRTNGHRLLAEDQGEELSTACPTLTVCTSPVQTPVVINASSAGEGGCGPPTITTTASVQRQQQQQQQQQRRRLPLARPTCPPPAIPLTTQRMTHSSPSTPQPATRLLKVGKNRSTNSLGVADGNGSNQSSNSQSSLSHGGGGAGKERIRVRILTPTARILVFQVDPNKRLADLKNEVILELSDDPASMPLFATDVRQLSPRYRLLRGNFAGVELNDSLTIAQLKIMDNDSLVLVVRRNTSTQQLNMQNKDLQAPRDAEIESATRNLTLHSSDMPMVDVNEIFQQSNLQFDVRKVLISLAQASANIIGAGPFAQRLIVMLKQKLINRRNYQEDTLQALVDMGFKREKADYALKTHHGVYAAALEWLLLHENDEMPLEEAAMAIQKSESLVSPSTIYVADNDIIDNTETLLDIVRIYSHRDIPPPPEAVESLINMGFEEKEVLTALRKTCNNKAAACEWLCGNRTGSLIELRDGLSQDSPILKAILELPQVQINLSNPKIFLAFLAILENENSLRVWGGDNDTTSVITHILQKYHEEKHVMGINQFYGDR